MKKTGLLILFLSFAILSFSASNNSSSSTVTKQKQKTNMVAIQKKLKDLVNIIKNILNNKEFHKEIFTDKYWEKTFLYMDLSSNLQKNHNSTKENLVKI